MKLHSFLWAEFKASPSYARRRNRVLIAALFIPALVGMALVQICFVLPAIVIDWIWGDSYEKVGNGLSYVLAAVLLCLYARFVIAWARAGCVVIEGIVVMGSLGAMVVMCLWGWAGLRP